MPFVRPAVRWLPIFVVVLGVSLCLPPASATRGPLGDELHAKGVEPGLQAPLQVVLGGRRDVHERLHAIEQNIRASYQALPKNANGNLAPRSVRHLMRSYFAKEHGWLIRGIEPHGMMRASCKALHEVAILREKTPFLARALLDTRQSERGLSFGDVVAVVAALEQLVLDESVMLLDAAYKLANHSTGVDLTEKELHFILQVYLLFLKHGGVYSALKDVNDGSVRWENIVLFERDTVLNTLHSLEERTNPFRPRKFNFLQAAQLVELLFERYGRWQNYECEKMKDDLVSLEKPSGSGRVPISSFYGKKDSNKVAHNFSESVEYLRNTGSIDDSSQSGPKLLISNYVQGPSNCLGKPFRYFSICCLNECDGIMSVIEGKIKWPSAPPERLLEIAANLTSSTVEHARKIPSALVAKMHFIAERNSGEVPLHGRLFAQWLHYIFPNECPYPQIIESLVRVTQDLFVSKATVEERQKHMAPPPAPEPETKREKREAFLSQWSDEEVLPLHEQNWSPGKSSLTTMRSTGWTAAQAAAWLLALRVLLIGVQMAWRRLQKFWPKEDEAAVDRPKKRQQRRQNEAPARQQRQNSKCHTEEKRDRASRKQSPYSSEEKHVQSSAQFNSSKSQDGAREFVGVHKDILKVVNDRAAAAAPTGPAPANGAPVAAAAQVATPKAESDIRERELSVVELSAHAKIPVVEGLVDKEAMCAKITPDVAAAQKEIEKRDEKKGEEKEEQQKLKDLPSPATCEVLMSRSQEAPAALVLEESHEAGLGAVGNALPELQLAAEPAEPIQVAVAEEASPGQVETVVTQLEAEKGSPLDQAPESQDTLCESQEALNSKPVQSGDAIAGRVGKEVKRLEAEHAVRSNPRAPRKGDRSLEKVSQLAPMQFSERWKRFHSLSQALVESQEEETSVNTAASGAVQTPVEAAPAEKPEEMGTSEALVEVQEEETSMDAEAPAAVAASDAAQMEVSPEAEPVEAPSTSEVQGDAPPASPEESPPEAALQVPEAPAETTGEAPLEPDSPEASAEAPLEDADAAPVAPLPRVDVIDTLPRALPEDTPGSPAPSLPGSPAQEQVASPGALPPAPSEAPPAPPETSPEVASPEPSSVEPPVAQSEAVIDLDEKEVSTSQDVRPSSPEQVPGSPPGEAVSEEAASEEDACAEDHANAGPKGQWYCRMVSVKEKICIRGRAFAGAAEGGAAVKAEVEPRVESDAATEAGEEVEAETPMVLELASDTAALEAACDADLQAQSLAEPNAELVSELAVDAVEDGAAQPESPAVAPADEAEARAEPAALPTLEQLSEATDGAAAAVEAAAEAEAAEAEAAETKAAEVDAAAMQDVASEVCGPDADDAAGSEVEDPGAEDGSVLAAAEEASDVLKEILGNSDPRLPSDCSGTTEWGMDASCTDKTCGTVADELDTQGGSDTSQLGSLEQHFQQKDLEDEQGATKTAYQASSELEEESCFTELPDNLGDAFPTMPPVHDMELTTVHLDEPCDFFADDTVDDRLPTDGKSVLLQSMDAEADKVQEPLRKAPPARQPFLPAEPPPPAPRLPPRPSVAARVNGVKAPPPAEPPVVVAKQKGPRVQVIPVGCPPDSAVRQGKPVAKAAAQQAKSPPSCSPSQAETCIPQKAEAKGPPFGLATPPSLPPVVVKPATGIKHAEGKAPPPLGTNAKDTLRCADTLRSSGKAPPEFKAPPPPFPAETTVRSAKSEKAHASAPEEVPVYSRVTSTESAMPLSSPPSSTSSPQPAPTESAAPISSQAGWAESESAMPMPRFLKVQKRNKMLKSSLPQVPESEQRVNDMPGEDLSEDEDLECSQLQHDWAPDLDGTDEQEKPVEQQEEHDEDQADPTPVVHPPECVQADPTPVVHPPEPSPEAIASILHCPEGAEAAPEATMELKAFLGLGLGNEGEDTKASTALNADPPSNPEREQQAKGQRMFKGFPTGDGFSLFTGCDPARSYFHAPGDNQGVPYDAMFAANPRNFFGIGANMRAGPQYQRTPGESEPEEEPPGQTFVMPEDVAQANMARTSKRKGARRKKGDVRSWTEMEALVASRMRFARPARSDGNAGVEWATGMWPGAWAGHGDGDAAWVTQAQAAGYHKLWGMPQADGTTEWYDMGKPGNAYMQHPAWRAAAEACPRWNPPQPSSEAGAHWAMPEPTRR